jgi:hypothetical protein
MSEREKFLAAIVGGLIALAGIWYLYSGYNDSVAVGRSQLATAQGELQKVKHAITRGERAVKQIEAWQQQSLPSNREKALSLYKAWLLDKAKAAGLTIDDINPAVQVTPPTSGFSAIGYQLTGSGSLSSVISLLYEFYRTPLLHQVARLQLDRPPGATQLRITFQAEALILPGAEATASLPQGETKRLRLASLGEYQKSLGERDLVTVYTPPKPVETAKTDRPAPPKFDDAEHAYFSGSTGIGDKFEAWVHVRTTGETLHLSPGESFKVGEFEGQVVSVEPRSMIFQSGNHKYRVALNQTLRKGTELGPDGQPLASDKRKAPDT